MGNLKWDLNMVGDLTDKTILITGASAGMGYEAARFLSGKGAEVIMACRNRKKAELALDRIKKENPSARVQVMKLELSDLDSVRHFADEFRAKIGKLDILINNAGLESKNYKESKQGYELTFAVNYLAHFLLTGLLLDLIANSADGRIVMYSSNGHAAGDGNFLIGKDRKYHSLKVYGNSKLACLMFAYKLNDELKKQNIPVKVYGVHPGWITTELERDHNVGRAYKWFVRQIGMPANLGIRSAVYAACDREAKSGDYIVPDGFMTFRGYPKVGKSSKLSHDKELQDNLWNMSEKMSGLSLEAIMGGMR